MELTKEYIEQYLQELKESIENDKYRVDNNTKRQKNNRLYIDYLMNEKQRKKILLSIVPEDFSCVLKNEHNGFEHEQLYVFGKRVKLARRFRSGYDRVRLYIKFNKLDNLFIIVISFHIQEYPLKFPFKTAKQ